MKHPPFNPWSSYLVEASAGSGKTWQLSRRFLALVLAGADPASILTVTFTKKAAAEMRERIVRDAVQLGLRSKEFNGFAEAIQSWSANSQTKLRSPETASRLILESTQSLKITTIDSLFVQWCQRFPFETSLILGDHKLSSPWDLLSNLDGERLASAAWGDVLMLAEDHHENRNLMSSILENAPNGSIKSLARAIDPLAQSETFIWYLTLLGHDSPVKTFAVNSAESDEDFLSTHSALFQNVISLASNEDKKSKALIHLMQKNFQGLIDEKIINASREALNGSTFAKAKKSGDPQFTQLSQILMDWTERSKLTNLNHTSQLIWTLYQARTQAVHRRKVSDARATFIDAAKGVSLLAMNPENQGGRAMAWSGIRHLMLDEFQDTSRLQWMIFESLSLELLSGQTYDAESGPRPSVFIVGDKKQSIYRFREAAPEVLDLAKDRLTDHGLIPITMSESFRSSSVILDFVNQIFSQSGFMSDFPLHAPAAVLQKNKSDSANYGTVTIFKPKDDLKSESDESKSSPRISAKDLIEDEAQLIAHHISQCIAGEIDQKVWDETIQSWREPQFSDFAILYPNSTHAHIFEDALRDQSIPSVRAETKGFFGRPEIQDLGSLVTWLTWPADTVALCSVLKSPICGLADYELQEILRDPSKDILQHLSTSHPDTYQLLKSLQNSHHVKSMSEIVGRLITKHHISAKYLRDFGPIEGPLAEANIFQWFDLVRNSSAEEALATHSWGKALDDASEEDETGNAQIASNAVSMMTIHKSKGLEFPCVIVTGTGKDWHRPEYQWIKDSRPGHEGLWYIGSKATRPESCQQIDDLIQISEVESRAEKERLLYVALTRASHHLVLSGFKSKDEISWMDMFIPAAKALSNSMSFVESEVSISISRPLKELHRIPEHIPDSRMSPDILPISMGQPPALILTASHHMQSTEKSNSILIQPRVPESLGQAYGTFVHKILELAIKKTTWSAKRLQTFFQEQISTALSDTESTHYMNVAKLDAEQLLSSQVWKDLTSTAVGLYCEIPMASLQGDHLIQCKPDLILHRQNGTWAIVDFKTIPLQETPTKSVCQELGYAEQVQIYAKTLGKITKQEHVDSYILFTHPISLVQI